MQEISNLFILLKSSSSKRVSDAKQSESLTRRVYSTE
jgi:hypothetical protein